MNSCRFDSFEQELNSFLPLKNSSFELTPVILGLSSLLDKNMNIPASEKEINKMADALKIEMGEEGNPEERIKILNHYFFTELVFAFDTRANDFISGKNIEGITNEDIINMHSIERVIKRRQGICLTMSLIYLMVAEKLNLPIYGVVVPNHIYVRYKENGRTGINIETTAAGIEAYNYDDKYGDFEFMDSEEMIYGKLLDHYTLIGTYLNNLGTAFLLKKNIHKADVLFKKSLQMAPGFPEAYLNSGAVSEITGDKERALEMYKKALEINPDYGLAHLRIGRLYLSEKRFLLAEGHLLKADKMIPGNIEIKKMLKEAKKGSL